LILEKQDGRCRLDTSGSGHEPVVGSCEHGIELSGLIKERIS
jgi:hypothetical protein